MRRLLAAVVLASCNKAGPPGTGSPPAQASVADESSAAAVVVEEPGATSVRAALRASDEGIAAFWEWWATLDSGARLKIATGEDTAGADALSQHVAAIHPSLAWEFGPGQSSEHALSLSGEGDPVGRLLAERWKRAGPGANATWSYFPSRQPLSPDALAGVTLTYEGVPIETAKVRIATEVDGLRPRLNLKLWHPAFAKLRPEARDGAAFVLLDNAVGEDGVESWIGTVQVVDSKPADSIALPELPAAVEALDDKTPEESYAIAEGTDPDSGQALLFNVNVTLRRWHHPFHDTWCEVSLPYTPDERGLPPRETLTKLQSLEAALREELGDAARHAGSATGAGVRRIWLYLDGDTDATTRAQQWAKAHAATVDTKFDPGWDELPI